MRWTKDEIDTALRYLEDQFLASGEFGARKQANAITAGCFRNTRLENFHSEGWISDKEIKNVNIETSARVEYLINSGGFDVMSPKEIFNFCFEETYKKHVDRKLRKPMWNALRTEAERNLQILKILKCDEPLMYRAKLLSTWAMYARYYDEKIKFDGEKLSDDPNSIPVGHRIT
jgi:hypothetical protein